MRRHDWVFDMLSDLRDYALANGLPDLSASVEVTLAVARQEIASIEALAAQIPARCDRAH